MNKKRFLVLLLAIALGVSFHLTPKTSLKLPIVFTAHPYHPFLDCVIEGKVYSFFIDSGASCSLYLSKNLLDQITNTPLKEQYESCDLRGNLYSSSVHSVPEINFGAFSLYSAEVIEESPAFQRNTTLQPSNTTPTWPSQGSVGWTFFKDYCTLFDFPNCAIFLGKSKEALIQDGVFKMKNFISIPFTIQQGIIVLPIETTLGTQRVALDTGSTYCIMHTQNIANQLKHLPSGVGYFQSEKLLIGGYDFGTQNFAALDISDRVEVDGVLGTDFFLEHAICFDFANNTVYIQKPGSWLSTQWQRGKFHLTHFFSSTR
jgi:hypothetical protein